MEVLITPGNFGFMFHKCYVAILVLVEVLITPGIIPAPVFLLFVAILVLVEVLITHSYEKVKTNLS